MKHTDALAVLRLVHGYHEAGRTGLTTFGLNAKFIKDVLEPIVPLAKEAPSDGEPLSARETRLYATIEQLRAENRELSERSEDFCEKRNEAFKQRDDAFERLANMRNDVESARLARDNFETALNNLRIRYTNMVEQRDGAFVDRNAALLSSKKRHAELNEANRNLVQMQAERNGAQAYIREIATQILNGSGTLDSVIDLVERARSSFGE